MKKRFSWAQLAVFVLVFGVIGAWLIYTGFALSPNSKKSGGGGSSKVVNVFVVVPSGSYAGGVTSAQAVSVVNGWLGQTTDQPCVGANTCLTEDWIKAETGKVFSYTVQAVNVTETIQQLAGSTPDACGSYGIGSTYVNVLNALKNEAGYNSQGQRTVMVVLGAGGTASHIFLPGTTSNGSQKAGGVATLGDWGISEQLGNRYSCIPDWDYPMRGWGHEFMGGLGAYCTSTGGNSCYDTDDNIYNGDPLTQQEITNLTTNSGQYLHN